MKWSFRIDNITVFQKWLYKVKIYIYIKIYYRTKINNNKNGKSRCQSSNLHVLTVILKAQWKDIFIRARGGIELLTRCSCFSARVGLEVVFGFFYFVKSTTIFEQSNTCKFGQRKWPVTWELGHWQICTSKSTSTVILLLAFAN